MRRHLRHPLVPAPAAAALYGLLCWLAAKKPGATDLCLRGDDLLAAIGAAMLIAAVYLTARRARQHAWRPVTQAAVTAAGGACLAPVMFVSWVAATVSACFPF